jgi:hypothetical protein
MTKVRVSIAVDGTIAEEIEKYWRSLVRKALDNNKKEIPKLSNVYESLIVEAWKTKKKY